MAVADAWRAFVAAPSRPDSGERTLERYGQQWAAFVAWLAKHHPASVRLREVTPEIAGDYVAHLRTNRGGGTINKHVRVCSLVFRTLRKSARMADDPFGREYVKRLQSVQEGRRELTVDELRAVCGKADGDLRPLIALGIYTGMRLKDCALLRWGEVDMKKNLIRRVPAKTARRNPRPVLVPIHSVLRDILAEAERKGDYVIPTVAQQYQDDTPGLSRRIQEHFTAAGIRTLKPGTGEKTGKRAVVEIGFHSLRHSFVSLCRTAGAPLAVVEAIVGHSNPAMTRLYSHVGEAAAADAVKLLPAVIGEAVPAAPVREPLPAWAREIVESMTEKTWKKRREALLA